MQQKKMTKYKKLIARNLRKIRKLFEKVQENIPTLRDSHSIRFFMEKFLDQHTDTQKKVVETLDIKSLQLFLKMYLYWIKDHQQFLKKKPIKQMMQKAQILLKAV